MAAEALEQEEMTPEEFLAATEHNWMIADFAAEVMAMNPKALRDLLPSEKEEIYRQWLLLPRQRGRARDGLPPGWANKGEVAVKLGITRAQIIEWENSQAFQSSLDEGLSQSRFSAIQKREMLDAVITEGETGNPIALSQYNRLAGEVNPQTALEKSKTDLADLDARQLFDLIVESAKAREDALGWKITHVGSKTTIDRDPPKDEVIQPPHRYKARTTEEVEGNDDDGAIVEVPQVAEVAEVPTA